MGLFMGFHGICRLLMYGQVGGSITPINMVYDTYDELVHAVYKPTYNRSCGPQKFWTWDETIPATMVTNITSIISLQLSFQPVNWSKLCDFNDELFASLKLLRDVTAYHIPTSWVDFHLPFGVLKHGNQKSPIEMEVYSKDSNLL